MEKLLIIVFIASCFGCSKKATPTPPQNSWVIGKWKGTTRYTYYVLGEIAKYDTTVVNNEFTFTSTSVTATNPTETSSYTLVSPDGPYIDDYLGSHWYFTKQSDTQFVIKGQYINPNQIIYNYTDVYIKE